MKRKIIKISMAVLVIAVIMLVAFGFTSRTIHYSGTLLEGGIESRVSIDVEYRRIDKLFNNMHGYVTIQSENHETPFDYKLFSSILTHPDEDIRFTTVIGYFDVFKNGGSSSAQDFVTLYFNKDLTNIVLISDGYADAGEPRREFYAADDAFRALVSDMTYSPES